MSNEFKISLGAELKKDSAQTIQNQINQMDLKINVSEINIQSNRIKNESVNLAKQVSDGFNQNLKLDMNVNTNQLDKQVQQSISIVEKLNNTLNSLHNKSLNLPINDLKQYEAYILQIETKLKSALSSTDTGFQNRVFKEAQTDIKNLNAELKYYNKEIRTTANETALAASKGRQLASLETYMKQNSKAVKEFGYSFDVLKKKINEASDPTQLKVLNSEISKLKHEIKGAGVEGRTFGEEFKNVAGKFSSWIGVSTVVMGAIHSVQNGFRNLRELDTQMVDLQKTARGTTEDIQNFYYTANDSAKDIGVTTAAIIEQASAWSRLGYSMRDAALMSENSAIFKAISPEMNETQATDGLVSVIKAFNYEAEDSLDIISAINEIGNNYAVDNIDIVDIMTRSSAAMAEANNTMEETIALGMAGVEITRDAAAMGNALKTVSMRIRGYDEETEKFTNDISRLKGEIASLTNGKVSIFADDEKETYKSTYQILKEVSKTWDELTDKQQAGLLETLGGKRQGQVIGAIINNFDQAESAIETMADSSGKAMQEMEFIYDSMDYKLNRLQETGVGIWQNVIDSDFIKTGIDLLADLLGIIDSITTSLGSMGTAGGVLGGILGAKGKGWTNYQLSTFLCPYRT